MQDAIGPGFIGLSVPHMATDLQVCLAEAFATNWVAHVGPTVDAFECDLARLVGVPGCFATHSGTAALHLALRLLGVGPSDVVFCSALSFIATANPILYQGASPVFIDAEPQSWGMSPVALERALAHARRVGRLPKAIIVAHLYGQSADMDPILSLSAAYGIPVIEDAAEALGATYKGRACGTLGHLGVYSFAGNKIVTTSTGGALVSNDAELVHRARYLGLQARDEQAHELHAELGYNYHMSNVLAGIGRSQLRVLNQRVDARRAVFTRYRRALEALSDIAWMPEASFGRATRWLSVLLLKASARLSASALVAALGERNIEARRVFKPLHQQPLYEGQPFFPHAREPVSERLFAQGVCIPSSSNLSAEDQARVIEELRRLLAQ